MAHEEQLKENLNEIQTEKDRIKGLLGEVGNKNNTQHRIVSLIFALLIVVLLVLGVALQKISLYLTLEIVAIVGLFKVIWMFYEFQRSMHFQFWILNSLEFRINDVDKRMKKIEKMLKEEKATVEKALGTKLIEDKAQEPEGEVKEETQPGQEEK